ncbi:hypothetical protein [Streptomyces sp. NPDC101178]|uniref:hypothetical protein n=1 Tax=Streptomyces sp. NPDC101178 TaxID=3366124 RepID=UPI00382A6026
MNLAFVESPVQLLNVLEWTHAMGGDDPAGTTVVVLPPVDPMSRGQLRRMAELARDEGITVRWQEARGDSGAPLKALRALAGLVRRADHIVIGDPFSRYVQLLLTLVRAERLTVVDDGTATMEFVTQLARGERLTRWHRKGRGGPRELLLAPVTATARRRFTPTARHEVEVFTAMPVEPPPGVTVTANTFAWTRARFGPPSVGRGADLVGTSLVETGVVDPVPYQEAVAALARTHGATRYFAHRRESAEKLHALEAATGLEIVRPDLPLELIARRGPIGHTVVSFPSTVVHTLPLALSGTGVNVAVCDIAPEWLRTTASPRAQGFLSGVTETARGVQRLTSTVHA